MPFKAKYLFLANNTVVIKHPNGAHLRCGNGNDDAYGNGGVGQFARWEVILQDDGDVRIKSKFSGKYLRIKAGGDVDVGGGTGPWTKFKVHVIKEPNVVKLESCKLEGKFIACNKKKKVFAGAGGAHCRLVFLKQGNDEDDNDEKDVESEPEPAPVDTDDDAEDDDGDDDDISDVECEALGEDAEAVKSWLDTIGYDKYFDAFIENGYDKMSTIAMLTTDDLAKMGVKAGHQKELMLAARAAVFVGHWVAIRNVKKQRFIEANEGNKEKLETNDKNKGKDCRWFVEQSSDSISKVRFRSKYNSYIQIQTGGNKHCRTISKAKNIDKRCDLQILPTEDNRRMNIVQIWCPSNANFLTYDSNIGKDRVNGDPLTNDEDDKDKQMWELIIDD